MKQNYPKNAHSVLLADDDIDDRYFFKKALESLAIHTHLTTVEDGEDLMKLLLSAKKLPEVLFLDLNMPRKNGSECLSEIKTNPKTQNLPVVIYSTSLHEDVAALLYKKGAHNYIRKGDFTGLQAALLHILTLISKKKFIRPAPEDFVVNLVST